MVSFSESSGKKLLFASEFIDAFVTHFYLESSTIWDYAGRMRIGEKQFK